jgi:hypothetical protein
MCGSFGRFLGVIGTFAMSMLMMGILCIWAWDAFVNGKLYYCTDGGSMDFIFVGDWVHYPETVAHITPRSMSQPDEILAGWSIAKLWCLWGVFAGGSVLVSALSASAIWRVCLPQKAVDLKPATPGR